MSSSDPSQNTSRLAAVAALAVAVIAVIAVAGGSLGEDGDGSTARSQERSADGAEQQQPRQRTKAKRYEVEEGDTLSAIAEKTGVPVEELERLNPEIDPQTLNAGEKLKLR